MLAYLHSYSSPFIEIIVLEWSIPATVGSFLPCWHCNDPQRTFLGKLYKLLVFFRINFYVVSLFYMQNLRNDFSSENRTKTKNKIIHVFKKFLKSLVLRKLLKINISWMKDANRRFSIFKGWKDMNLRFLISKRWEQKPWIYPHVFWFSTVGDKRRKSSCFNFQALETKDVDLYISISKRWGQRTRI